MIKSNPRTAEQNLKLKFFGYYKAWVSKSVLGPRYFFVPPNISSPFIWL